MTHAVRWSALGAPDRHSEPEPLFGPRSHYPVYGPRCGGRQDSFGASRTRRLQTPSGTGRRMARCKTRVRCTCGVPRASVRVRSGGAGRSKSSELSKSGPDARASGAGATKKPRSGCTPAGAFVSGRRAAEPSSAGLPIDFRETYAMNSPFMGRETEYGHGLPSRPRADAGPVRRCGRCAPFADMVEVFGKVLLSFRAGGRPSS